MARNNERRDRSAEREEPELLEKLVGINRVAEVVRRAPFWFCGTCCSRR